MIKKLSYIFIIIGISSTANATILFQDNATGTCKTAVSQSLWDPSQSGNYPHNQMYYRCDTPLPGRTIYYRVDTINQQHDSWNLYDVGTITMTPGVTYYLAGFFRFDRVNDVDIWHDGDGEPYSYDKLFEFYDGTARAIIAAGFPDWATCSGGACDHKFTFGLYMPHEYCDGCIYEQVEPNVSPYTRRNFILCDYGKWYAVVYGFTPSTGATKNGRVQLWINGVKTTDRQNIKTQNSANPYFHMIEHSGTTAQPAYDAPAHYRKIDGLIFTNSLSDIMALGYMQNPEQQATTYTVTPSAGANGRISHKTPQNVRSGATTQFIVTPHIGYTASVGGTCGGILVGTTYRTKAITANCTVVASFALINYTVTPSAGAHVTIDPNTPQSVGSGLTNQFTITPDTGYRASVGTR